MLTAPLAWSVEHRLQQRPLLIGQITWIRHAAHRDDQRPGGNRDTPSKTHCVRIDQEKNARGMNIAERVQPIAPHQPGWPYHWRADAETRHSELDRRMDWKRMPYYRPVNQDLFMLAEAMIGNERAYGEWLSRRAEAAERTAS